MKNHAPTESFGFLLHDTARMLRRRFDQQARSLGLTRAQWQLLAVLARNEGLNQAQLAERMELEPISLCRLVDRMEEGGWVRRRPDPGDRRARLIFMTRRATERLPEMRAMAEEVYAEALEGLPPETRTLLMDALAHVRGNLARRNGDEQPPAQTAAKA
jgi:DNA-binding MarR family transcriptional regulator